LIGAAMDRLDAAPAAVVGCGFGGWVAAELVARSPSRVSRLGLHAPLGVRPAEGEVVDQFLIDAPQYVEMGFTSTEAYARAFPDGEAAHFDEWDRNRETTTRVAWKPYMHHPGLKYLLREIRVPTLVTWARGDKIAPRSAALAHAEAIPGARFLEFNQGGHRMELEQPDRLADAILDHLGAAAPATADSF
jgi:pimeloyl-ACP methyl ester carboxylesterase